MSNTTEIKPSSRTKYSTVDSTLITDKVSIDGIIDYLYTNSLAYMKPRDRLPNESPDVYMIFSDNNGNEKARLMFYGGGYIVDEITNKRYKAENENFIAEVMEWFVRNKNFTQAEQP